MSASDRLGYIEQQAIASRARAQTTVDADLCDRGVPQLINALQAVLMIHRPISQNVFAATPLADPVDVCRYCNTVAYPCPTARAIEEALP